VEATELIINAVRDKRELISELKKRISICERSCVSLKDMQLQLGQMKSNNQVDPSFQEEYQKLKIVVDQQKLQLQSDVHFLLEKDTPFVEQCIDIVDTSSVLSPRYLE
jgi:singapore isolate B (sub-type 7) whole genome shotgun sequence assembly, scaffold_2